MSVNRNENSNGNLLDEIQKSISIEEIIHNLLGNPTNITSSGEFMYHCPFHDDKRPSFSINPDKGMWICFAGCGKGNIINLWQRMKNLSFKETIMNIQETFGVRLNYTRDNGKRNSLLRICDYAEYTKLPIEFLKDEIGLFEENGEVCISYYDEHGDFVAIKRRLRLHGKHRFAWKKGSKVTLYGLWWHKEWSEVKHLYLVEGESDCHVAWWNGIPSLGVPGATSFTQKHWEIIQNLLPNLQEVIVVKEPDKAGETFANKILKTKPRGIEVKVISLKEHKDLRDCWVQLVAQQQGDYCSKYAKEEFKDILFGAEEDTQNDGKYSHTTPFFEVKDGMNSQDWLWEGWIPNGVLTLLVGHSNVGKTTFAMHLCRAVTRGEKWTDIGEEKADKGYAIWVDTENIIGILAEKVQKFDVPGDRIHLFGKFVDGIALDMKRLDRQEGMDALDIAIQEVNPSIIVIDSLGGAFIGEENSKKEISFFMKGLMDLAAKHNIAIVIIHHLKKKSEFESGSSINIHKVRGSSAIVQFVRSIIWLDRPYSEDMDLVRVSQAKPMFSKPNPLAFRIYDHGLEFEELPDEVNGDEAQEEEYSARTQMEEAMALLKFMLREEPRLAADIYKASASEGISNNTLKRAKKKLNVVSRRKNDRWYWGFSNQMHMLDEEEVKPDSLEEKKERKIFRSQWFD